MNAETQPLCGEGDNNALFSPGFLIDPMNTIDIRVLIQKTKANSDFMDQNFLVIFDELIDETAGFRHRNGAGEILSYLAHRFSHFFSTMSSSNNPEFTSLYLAWTRLSEEFGNNEALRTKAS